MNNRPVEDSKPWYRQFWPWFLIALPASVVVAGLTTVYIAFKGADSLVNDNYYREGLAINQRLEQDQKAAAMALSAVIQVDQESGELFVTLTGEGVTDSKLILQLLHPTDEKGDKQFLLSPISPGYYRTDLDLKLNHRYYLRLFPEFNPVWRLNGEIDFSHDNQVTLTAE